MNDNTKPATDEKAEGQSIPTASVVRHGEALVEIVYDPEKRRTSFVVWKDNGWKFEDSFEIGEAERLVPFSANNNLIKNEVVLLPAEPAEYGTEEELLADIRSFIHRYVDVSPLFEKVASYYVLLSWIYDAFNELPYLRLRGDYGTGKTRFLLTVGSHCYKAFFASGASTISPIFHTLDAFHGTLIIDEGDFRFSDEKAEIVKILNNVNVRGMPVLRLAGDVLFVVTPITLDWVGMIIRRKLRVATRKSHGVFVVPLAEKGQLERLYERYGVTAREDPQPQEGTSP